MHYQGWSRWGSVFVSLGVGQFIKFHLYSPNKLCYWNQKRYKIRFSDFIHFENSKMFVLIDKYIYFFFVLWPFETHYMKIFPFNITSMVDQRKLIATTNTFIYVYPCIYCLGSYYNGIMQFLQRLSNYIFVATKLEADHRIWIIYNPFQRISCHHNWLTISDFISFYWFHLEI